jgi:HEAT repeat protein
VSPDEALDPRFLRRCWAIALLLVLLLPVLRLVEALARLILLPSYYDSFWHALMAEMWFSDLWWLYANTPLGWCVSRALVLWIVAVPLMVLLPWIRHRVAYALAVAGTCFLVLSMVTNRLEFDWDGRSQSEWAWCLRSRDPELRRQAAKGLSSYPFWDKVPEGTVLLVRQALRDEVPEVRRFAAAFFIWDRAEAGSELAEALADPDDQVRSNAAWALAQRAPAAARALPQLKVCLTDPVPMVRANAATAYLGGGGDQALGVTTFQQATAELTSKERSRIGWGLAHIPLEYPDGAMPLLTILLRDEDKEVRYDTTSGLVYCGGKAKPLTPALVANLKDSDPRVRGCSAWALGRIGSAENHVVAAVVPLLKDPDATVRSEAAYALGLMRAVQARPALKEALNDPNSDVSASARGALDLLP